MPDPNDNPLERLAPPGSFPGPDDTRRIKPEPKRPDDFPTDIPVGGYPNKENPNGPPTAGRIWRLPESPGENAFEFMFGGKAPPLKNLALADPVQLAFDLGDKNVRDGLVNEGQWYGNLGNQDSTGATDIAKFFTEEPSWYDPKAHPELHNETNPVYQALDFISKKLMQGKMSKEAAEKARIDSRDKEMEESFDVADQQLAPRQGVTTIETPDHLK